MTLCHLSSVFSSSHPEAADFQPHVQLQQLAGLKRDQDSREPAPICLLPGQASPGEPLQPRHPPHRQAVYSSWLLSLGRPVQLPALLRPLSVLCPGLPEAACQSDCMSVLCPGHRGPQLPGSCCSALDWKLRGLTPSGDSTWGAQRLCVREVALGYESPQLQPGQRAGRGQVRFLRPVPPDCAASDSSTP